MNESEDWNVIEEKLVKFTLNTFQIVSHCICIIVGSMVNISVGSVLIFNRRLHNARNTIYLGVVFSNLLTLFMALMEILAVCWSNQTACTIYTMLMGKPYVLVLLNFLLAASDRCFYITNPIGHKRHVTVSRVLVIEFTFSVVILASMTTSYWMWGAQIRCGLDLEANKWTPRVMIIINMSCFILKGVVYRMTKKCIATEMKYGFMTKQIPMASLSKRIVQVAHLPSSSSLPTTSYIVHCNHKRFSRMELEATTAFVAGLIPLCIFTLPVYFWAFWEWFCKNVFHSWNSMNYIYIYPRELLLVHVCTNLLVLIFLSKEFRSTVRDNLIQIQHRFGIRTQTEI